MASPSITAVTPRIAQTGAMAIQQRVNSTFNFDGTLPQLASVRADSPVGIDGTIYKYAPLAAAGGGLFFFNTLEPLVCSQIHVDLGASGDINISIVNLDPAHINDDQPTLLSGESILIESSTGQRFLALDEARFKTILLPYQAIQIVTTTSGDAQIAQVVASLERTYVR
jgi:hypothetical protein